MNLLRRVRPLVPKVLAFLVATGIPLVVFARGHFREIKVATEFVLYELGALVKWSLPVMIVLALVAFVSALVLRRSRVGIARLALQAVLVAAEAPALRPAIMVGCVLVAALALRAESIRYRLYSQTHYQLGALDRVRSGDMAGAEAICRSYVGLFPQRAASGAIPDGVCVPLLELGDGMSALAAYIARRSIEPRDVNGLTIPAAWEGRHRAIAVTRWLGGVAAAPEGVSLSRGISGDRLHSGARSSLSEHRDSSPEKQASDQNVSPRTLLRGSHGVDCTDLVESMKCDLLDLVTAEESYFADSVRYTQLIGPVGVHYTSRPGNTMPTITLTHDGWVGVIRSTTSAKTCMIFIGSTPIPPATKEGEPECR